MNDGLHRKCEGCSKLVKTKDGSKVWRPLFWLGDMWWRGDKRYCADCAGEYRYA